MLLKEVYNDNFLNHLATELVCYDSKFDKKTFLKISQNEFQNMELKTRMRFISRRLHDFLNHLEHFKQINLLKKVIVTFPKTKSNALALIVFPDFVEISENIYFDLAMKSLEFFTEFGTSEFAVRRFIKENSTKSLQIFDKWAESDNYHIRRLASEGLRPRLPWGCVLEEFKKNPKPILPILEKLKFDEEEYVRRSVANNLNDISKDHPKTVLKLLKIWKEQGVDQKLIKHALRTLLKKGDEDALSLIGIKKSQKNQNFAIQNFSLQKVEIKKPAKSQGREISDDLTFDFILKNNSENSLIRLEYAISFLRSNGSHSEKVFQITTKSFEKGEFSFSKKHSFREITTRKYYSGKHFISLVVNGSKQNSLTFYLV